MITTFLQDILDDISSTHLPYTWNSFDLKTLSNKIELWDFQQEAIVNALKVLWKYYEDFYDFQPEESIEFNLERKRKLYQWYKDNGLNENLDIKLDRRSRKLNELLPDFFKQEDGKISYLNYINRMCFWMATGSGKTIVLIKLIQILKILMERKEIPEYDILFLTHRDDLLEQFKKMVDEVNLANASKIELRELKEYPEVKRQKLLTGAPVFYYRSDNINDEQKEKIIDFHNYDNGGKWFVFLDEAHKGDKEDSKRQHIYSILARNGFLFNFSATFIDQRDILTSAFEFNLASFIQAGYGKHISVLQQEIRAFRKDEDYSDEEKQKIVLKSLIVLTYLKKYYEKIENINIEEHLYHNPLLLTLVNSVNTVEADLKIFFRELERIGKGGIKADTFNQTIEELWEELKQEPEFVFEDNRGIKIDEKCFKEINIKDIINYVFNSDSPGKIEVSFRPSDKKQVAFKLTTSDRHFALSKTGDMPSWLREELDRFNVNHQFEEEGFFERINKDESPINILMGSRAFYEGWDSNRPNVLNFINIGTGVVAKKFILQSVGRGIRIEPITNKRRRLKEIYNDKDIDIDIFRELKDIVTPLETLFIFGTNRSALLTVINELKQERKEKGEQLSFFVNKSIEKQNLLIPTYKPAGHSIMKTGKQAKFEVCESDIKLLQKYVNYIDDDKIFLVNYNTTPEKIKVLRNTFDDVEKYYKTGEEAKRFKNIDIFVQRIFDYFDVIPEELKEFKHLEDEIKHFKNIKVHLEDLKELQQKINEVKDYPERQKEFEKELAKLSISARKKIENMLAQEATETYEYEHKKIKLKYIANHYYVPIVFSDEEKIDYMTHIIKTPSEVKFINDLETYLNKDNNYFKKFDWWTFCKIDESLDEIHVPYYNPDGNKISKFKPDFIFWFKKDNNYSIVFIDPKGIKHSDYMHKIDGYRMIFEDNKGRIRDFKYQDFTCKVYTFLRTDDINRVSEGGYKEYWFDSIERALERIL